MTVQGKNKKLPRRKLTDKEQLLIDKFAALMVDRLFQDLELDKVKKLYNKKQ